MKDSLQDDANIIKILNELFKVVSNEGGSFTFKAINCKTKEVSIPTDLDYYYKRIAKKMMRPYEEVKLMMQLLIINYPVAAFSLVLKEIQTTFKEAKTQKLKEWNSTFGKLTFITDKDVDEDADSDVKYYISIQDGEIHSISKSCLNGEYASFFDSLKDAEDALAIVKDLHKILFGNNKSNKNNK